MVYAKFWIYNRSGLDLFFGEGAHGMHLHGKVCIGDADIPI